MLSHLSLLLFWWIYGNFLVFLFVGWYPHFIRMHFVFGLSFFSRALKPHSSAHALRWTPFTFELNPQKKEPFVPRNATGPQITLIGNSFKASLVPGLSYNVNAPGSTAASAAITDCNPTISLQLLKAWVGCTLHCCSRFDHSLGCSFCYSRTALLRKENHGLWSIRCRKLVGGKMFFLHWWEAQSAATTA